MGFGKAKYDVEEKGLDPKQAHSVVAVDGRLAKPEEVQGATAPEAFERVREGMHLGVKEVEVKEDSVDLTLADPLVEDSKFVLEMDPEDAEVPLAEEVAVEPEPVVPEEVEEETALETAVEEVEEEAVEEEKAAPKKKTATTKKKTSKK